nr:MAG TPA: hypothetical protein [Caudoviricetes sp.]
MPLDFCVNIFNLFFFYNNLIFHYWKFLIQYS